MSERRDPDYPYEPEPEESPVGVYPEREKLDEPYERGTVGVYDREERAGPAFSTWAIILTLVILALLAILVIQFVL